MNDSMVRATKIHTVLLALIAGVCLVFVFQAGSRADRAVRQRRAWQAEATKARATMREVLHQNRAVVRENRRLVRRYRQVVADARKLVAARVLADRQAQARAQVLAQAAQAAAARAAKPAVVSSGGGSNSGGGGAAASPSPGSASPSSGTS